MFIGCRRIQDCKIFLCAPENKPGLITFVGDCAISQYNELDLQEHDEIFIAGSFQNL